MVREIIISLYLLIFQTIFRILSLLPLKNRITFVISFGDNSKYVYDEMVKQDRETDVVILYKGTANQYFKNDDVTCIPFETANIVSFIRSIAYLATSKRILVDNYYGFLSVTQFKNEVEVIQLWHASGALKKFGLEDQSNRYRTDKAQKRFLKVYQKFDKVIVGSDVMANTFKRSFHLSDERILRTGIPRTDFFYDEKMKKTIKKKIEDANPEIVGKKKLLYAPTYRDQQLDHFRLALDLDKLHTELGDEYVVLLRLHPAIQDEFHLTGKLSSFVFDFSGPAYDINDLLVVSDILITDYSSIPFEFSLTHKPMIFFAYDLETYREERGLMENFELEVPGPVVKTTDEIINIVKEQAFQLNEIKEYARKWNKYSTGHSSKQLVHYLFEGKTEAKEMESKVL